MLDSVVLGCVVTKRIVLYGFLTGLTALYVAADDGYAEIVRMLIRHGANPAVQTPTGGAYILHL